ncbi:MAG: hypothetical protein GC185_05640 [Alphaproteobacteria bacterium]|nr:hypothetical protein [Alphaproteobacteria bacterium]
MRHSYNQLHLEYKQENGNIRFSEYSEHRRERRKDRAISAWMVLRPFALPENRRGFFRIFLTRMRALFNQVDMQHRVYVKNLFAAQM